MQSSTSVTGTGNLPCIPADVRERVYALALSEWPHDYAMQLFVIRKQFAAWAEIQSMRAAADPLETLRTIAQALGMVVGDDHAGVNALVSTMTECEALARRAIGGAR